MALSEEAFPDIKVKQPDGTEVVAPHPATLDNAKNLGQLAEQAAAASLGQLSEQVDNTEGAPGFPHQGPKPHEDNHSPES